MRHNEKISVLVVDSLPVVRWGTRHLLEIHDFKVVDEADTIENAVVRARSLNPKIIITGMALTDGTGIDMMRQLTGEDIIFLAFSMSESWGTVEAFINAGGSGFVSKKAPPEELLDAINAIINGHQWISPRIRKNAEGKSSTGPIFLSKRENEIAGLVARGLTTRQSPPLQ